MTLCAVAARVSAAISRPLMIVVFPFACWAWLLFGGSVNALTLLLSVIAITITQLILLDQGRYTEAEHAKLDALLRGTDADESVVGTERL